MSTEASDPVRVKTHNYCSGQISNDNSCCKMIKFHMSRTVISASEAILSYLYIFGVDGI